MANIFLNKFTNFEKFIVKKIRKPRPFPIQLDITNSCNLSCSHCYHADHTNFKLMGFEQWKNVIDQYFQFIEDLNYEPIVIFCGGEPTASPHLFPLIEYIQMKDANTQFVILTNGTLLSEKMALKFKLVKNVVFQISLDGPDKNKHDEIRGFGSFDKTMRGISILNENKLSFSILAVLSKKSKPWVENFFMLGRSINAASVNFTRIVELGFAKRSNISNMNSLLTDLEPLQLQAAYAEMIFWASKYKIKTNTHAPLYSLLSPGLGRNGRFWESLVINYQGNILLSSRSGIVIGSVLDEKLIDVFKHNPLLKRLRKGQINKCGSCELLKTCGGDRNIAYAKTGDFFGEDPGCWKKYILKEEKMKFKFFKKIALSVLALIPIESISIAASSSILDLAGEEQNQNLISSLRSSRMLLMPVGVYNTSTIDARNRMANALGVSDETTLDIEFKKHLDFLHKNGIISFDENQIVSAAPSWVKI